MLSGRLHSSCHSPSNGGSSSAGAPSRCRLCHSARMSTLFALRTHVHYAYIAGQAGCFCGPYRLPWPRQIPWRSEIRVEFQSAARVRGPLCEIGGEDAGRPLWRSTPTVQHLSVTQVAKATNLTRAAARRFLLTLTNLGYLSSDGAAFSLTPRVLDIGAGFLAGLDLPKIAQPHLNQLAHELDESATLSILDGDDIVYIARAAAPRLHAVTVNLGNRLPAWATSMGRMLIAELPETFQQEFLERVEISPFTDHTVSSAAELGKELHRIRDQGWCLVSQELDDGLRGLAVPVRRGQKHFWPRSTSPCTPHIFAVSRSKTTWCRTCNGSRSQSPRTSAVGRTDPVPTMPCTRGSPALIGERHSSVRGTSSLRRAVKHLRSGKSAPPRQSAGSSVAPPSASSGAEASSGPSGGFRRGGGRGRR